MRDYAAFLDAKTHSGAPSGFNPIWMPSFLFGFQGALTEFGIERGRGAIFADCGLGKTAMELVWGENVVRHTNRPVLNLTPLAVAAQTVREADKFGIFAERSRDGKFGPGAHIIVANYERLHYFNPDDFAGVICDESSCIKNFNGERRQQVTAFMRKIPYRLLGTATAAPNDYIELGTSSEALGELGHMDMLNRFFRNDQNTSDTRMLKRNPISHGGPSSNGWRFKGHAEQHFWKFVCGWARACRKPSDLGFPDDGFELPPLIERDHVVEARQLREGFLFAFPAENRRDELEERRRTINERCEKAAELVSGTGNPAVLWCHLNDEGDLLEKLIQGSRQVSSRTSDDEREEIYEAFSRGQLKDLIIKDRIGAWGLNWQHCNHVVRFATHSQESHYQAVRRCWRFGQKRPVYVDLIATEGEARISANLKRKAQQADEMFKNLITNMNRSMRIRAIDYDNKMEAPAWL